MIIFLYFTGNKIWKLVYYMPYYLPGQTVCHFGCLCRDAIKLDKPELYELTSDPGERNPLDIDSTEEYKKLAAIMNKAKEEHEKTVAHVQPQLSLYNSLWRPHMQPCCNFPYCSCEDSKYKNYEYKF